MGLTSEQFVALLAAHQRELYRYILALMPSAADADDVFQETTMAMYADRDRFEPGTNFPAWACVTARHRVLAHFKKSGRDRHVFSPELIDLISEERGTMTDELAQRRAALDQCLRRLTEHQRDLLDCRYGKSETIRQLAQRSGRPVKTLYKTLERIRLSLMNCVERALAEDEA